MISIPVKLAHTSYPIHIGKGLLNNDECLKSSISNQQIFIVTNDTVAKHYLEPILATFKSFQVDYLILPDGEQFKTIATWENILNELLIKKHDRSTTLCALGGGVVGDITGFAAACYRRGVPFVQLPTTLLAQVDASIGGKTAVNHPRGKNMIGAFYQPNAVIIDIDTLSTLPEREYRAGLAEVIKYGLIRDAEFFHWFKANVENILARKPDCLMTMIERACQHKVDVVVGDELEQGDRALLNFGHTFGHVIESATHYQRFLHGEAVAAGMVMAAELSAKHGWIQDSDVKQIRDLLTELKLPTWAPEDISGPAFLQAMFLDKKVLRGQLRLVLLKALGQAFVTPDYNPDFLKEIL